MALKQRKTTRWMARVGTWSKATIWFVAEVLSSFLNFREEDGLREKSIKTADLLVRRVLYFGMDYGLTILSVTIGVTMKALGFSLLMMFGVLWVFDFVVAGFFVTIYETTGKDLSLGVDFRRAVDTMEKKSRLLGFLTTLWIAFLAIVWTGPEKVITFFRKEIGTTERLMAVLTVLTAIQAFLWAALYSFAYDLVAKLL